MTTEVNTTRVNLAERSYDIEIGSGNLAGLALFLRERTRSNHAVIITDTHVDELYADRLGDHLTDHAWEVHILVVDAGEASKAAEVAEGLWETMLEEGTDRQSIVLAVGGGVVGDLAGFVASTFTRGLQFFQVPTTLLAQVDSSVGGKVGINLPGAKNMVGAFWQPEGVLIDVDVLATLPDREYRAGLGEVVKYGVILDADFFCVSRKKHRRPQRQRPCHFAAHRRALLPPQGRRRRKRRTRNDWPPRRTQLRPHLRPRFRGGRQLRRNAARRGGFDRHDVRRAAREADEPH